MRSRPILQELNAQLVADAPLLDAASELFLRPKGTERWTFNWHGEPVERLIIYLRSDVGCEYGVKTGGCTGCRHFRLGTAGRRVAVADLFVTQYRAVADADGLAPVVCVYNEGNMLNARELPTDQLLAIVGHARDHGVRRLVLESRVEYITDPVLAALRDAAGTMEIEIGIGLESSHDFIRNELFLKSLSLNAYERALSRMARYAVRSLAYVILKPAFLNEAQAITDALRTVDYAFAAGTDAVSIEPIGVEPHTVTALMAEQGLFRPAWLWSVIDVVRATHGQGEVRIGGFQFDPLPVTLPRNCDSCTPDALARIDRYNLTYDPTVLDGLACVCRSDYLRELSGLNPTIDAGDLAASLRRFVAGVGPAATTALSAGVFYICHR